MFLVGRLAAQACSRCAVKLKTAPAGGGPSFHDVAWQAQQLQCSHVFPLLSGVRFAPTYLAGWTLSKLVRRAGLIVGRIERYAGQQKITLGKCDDAAALVRLMVCGAADALCKLTRVLFILGQTLPPSSLVRFPPVLRYEPCSKH